jgi:hypothetical protein
VLGDITNHNQAVTPVKGGNVAMKPFLQWTPNSRCTPRKRIESLTNSTKKRRMEQTELTTPARDSAADYQMLSPIHGTKSRCPSRSSSEDSSVGAMHLSETPSPNPTFFDSNGTEICVELGDFPFKVPEPISFVELDVAEQLEDFPEMDMYIPGFDSD